MLYSLRNFIGLFSWFYPHFYLGCNELFWNWSIEHKCIHMLVEETYKYVCTNTANSFRLKMAAHVLGLVLHLHKCLGFWNIVARIPLCQFKKSESKWKHRNLSPIKYSSPGNKNLFTGVKTIVNNLETVFFLLCVVWFFSPSSLCGFFFFSHLQLEDKISDLHSQFHWVPFTFGS